ncbi:helix-turn-helix domain-containing protein [Mycolicibacterium madagascariense]|uniref:helix-turn-helix domain-containing protein n=1 Tax=Mycolicibacterium madagascariense TaxID=212765 RepID=UPI001FE818F4|nr:helix-turn-helix domain-containing protein [Mycolicibacterium madagascariense]
MRSQEDFDEVQRLIAAGMNDCQIARVTGIPRPTVREWRSRPPSRRPRPSRSSRCGFVHDFAALGAAEYSYLLGLYLGDGCLSRDRRVWRLRIVLDAKYPAIIDRCRQAIDAVMPGQRASATKQSSNCFEVGLYSKHWPCLLPQHGPGRKHHRRIVLEPWQQKLVDQATEEFVCGLIHSDGCRVIANDRGVESIRYHFSNRSEDIIGLFTTALDSLGIPWTRSTKYIVSVYRKAATARLDKFIGPKSVAVPWTNVHYTA